MNDDSGNSGHQSTAHPVSTGNDAQTERAYSSNGLGTKDIAARIIVGDWLSTERREYADQKYRRDGENWGRLLLDMGSFGISDMGQWKQTLDRHLERAQLLGVETPAGQQEFGKFIVTALSCFEACVMVNGRPPMPGLPSGMIEPWQREGE